MYNENLKAEYIKECIQNDNRKRVCMTLFQALEKYETKWQADICTQDENSLQPVIEELVGFRARSKYMTLIILENYAKWCIEKRVEGARNSIKNVNIVGLDKIRRQTVSSPAHLESYLNEICEPVEEMTTDNIYRCYYWLAFAGIREEDILKVKCSDVDFKTMTVKYNDTEVLIYRDAVMAFKNCTELNHFFYKHPNYSPDKAVWKDRAPGDTVVRGIKPPSIKTLRVELSRRSKKKRDEGATDLKLSYYRVWISGVFYRMSEREQIDGIEPDFTGIVYKQLNGKTYKLDSGRNTQEAKMRQLARDYLNDYNRWKLAHKK